MKQYRFLEVTTVYPIYLQSLYNNKPKMNSFEEFMNCYFESCYCESNYIERYLESELGIEAQLVCYNNEYAQNCWDSNTDKDPFHILLRQIKAINPDVLYISDINIFTPDQILCIKNTGKKGMKLICYHFSFLTKNVINTLKHYDLCFTGSLKYVKEMSNFTFFV